jgi:hypothetical protein
VLKFTPPPHIHTHTHQYQFCIFVNFVCTSKQPIKGKRKFNNQIRIIQKLITLKRAALVLRQKNKAGSSYGAEKHEHHSNTATNAVISYSLVMSSLVMSPLVPLSSLVTTCRHCHHCHHLSCNHWHHCHRLSPLVATVTTVITCHVITCHVTTGTTGTCLGLNYQNLIKV